MSDTAKETATDSARAWNHRIAIVEDDPTVREHFFEILSDQDGLDLAWFAGNLGKAREQLSQRQQPDLILLDIGLPDGNGLDFIPVIRDLSDAKVLIVTSFGDRETVVGAIRAGADGYLLKDSSVNQILDGIEATLAGGAPVSAAAAVYLLDRLRRGRTCIVITHQQDVVKRADRVLHLVRGRIVAEAAGRHLLDQTG